MYICNIDSFISILQTKCEIIMYITALLTFMIIGGLPSFVEDIKVGLTFHQKVGFLLKIQILLKYYTIH
jgi:hypothetical protein